MITKSIILGDLDRLFRLPGLHLLLSIAADEVGVGLGPFPGWEEVQARLETIHGLL